MGRPEQPIRDDGGPVAAFAAALRRLREDAGSPTYRRLAERTHYAQSVLSAATRGAQLPTWPVTEAFVLACGGNLEDWQARWRVASEAVRPPVVADPQLRIVSPDDPSQLLRGPSGPRTLPAATAAFTGRAAEITALVRLAESAYADVNSSASAVAVIAGMAGVGKTAFALRTAHLLAPRFPHGQLYIDLHGFTAGLAPREPADALAVLLGSLGLPPERIPADFDARAAVYRDRLRDTRTLLVLDNAASESQVRDLLPGGGGSLVLITSRRRFKALDDAHVVALDPLPDADAVELLRRTSGLDRADADDELMAEVAELCGRLPLALRISAALVRHRPAWTARRLAEKLREDRGGLRAFTDGDRDVAALFDLSYGALPSGDQPCFRLLSLIPGTDVDAGAAAALLAVDPAEAEQLLHDLADHHLVEEAAPGRFRLHDLVRLYARALAGKEDADDTRAAAVRRLTDHYADVAARADACIAMYTRPGRAESAPSSDAMLTSAAAVEKESAARAWFDAERANIRACIDVAVAEERHADVVRLTAGLASVLRITGPWAEALSLHVAAAECAVRDFDEVGHANALVDMGNVRGLCGDFTGALRDFAAAEELYVRQGERRGEANTLSQQVGVLRVSGGVVEALGKAERAVALFTAVDDRRGLAGASIESGMARYLAGDLAAGADDLSKALHLYREVGSAAGQAAAGSTLGGILRSCGDLTGAIEHLQEAATLARALNNRHRLAGAMADLCITLMETGADQEARRASEESVHLYRSLDNVSGQILALYARARVHAGTGDPAAAVRDCQEALALCRRTGARGSEAWVRNLYGSLEAAAGDHASSLAQYSEALVLAHATEMRSEQLAALEGIGECHLTAGRTDAAVDALRQALAVAREHGLPDADRLSRRLADMGI